MKVSEIAFTIKGVKGRGMENLVVPERTVCKHSINLEGDRTKFIHGVNYCAVCEKENSSP